jgi:DNA helicase-2/ATP-dependent DNA helicase PcrA
VTRPVISSRSTTVSHNTGLAFQLGDRVRHHRFGEGVVVNYEGQGPQAQIIVRFSKEGTKRLVLELAKLEKA